MSAPLSREFLLNRGFCCENECLNCPYKKEKIMNFEEWYKNNVMPGTVGHDTAKNAWNACKQEILKILKYSEYMDEFVIEQLKKKIEKL